jgi:ABC-2 type transport system ATP-binding protein/lipopolysaccharide transport system ATP-binding protein
VSSVLRRPARRPHAIADELWALRRITFDVDRGELVGVIGRNGAGKTTLLRILARITLPTNGLSRTRGRVGSLLEIGTGFHPELTGAENVYLNGAVLGMARRDIRRRYDEIVAFSGVERFLDTPLKRYSSGMQLRLAFAVAAHLEPETMVVDEVLAVGDAEFQRRCLGKMSDLTGEGRTAMFVSHDLGAVTRLCPRTIWLDDGVIRGDGPSEQVVESYLKASLASALPHVRFERSGDEPVQLLSVAVTDPSGLAAAPRRDESLSIRVRFLVRQRTPALDLSLYVLNRRGLTVLHESWSDARAGHEQADEPGEYEACMTIPPLLPAGEYLLRAWIGFPIGSGDFETLVEREALTFEIGALPGDLQDSVTRDRVAQPAVEWQVRSSTAVQHIERR